MTSAVRQGHEILAGVYGPSERDVAPLRWLRIRRARPFRESDFAFSADYWRVDARAPSGQDPDTTDWHGPEKSVDAVGKMLA